MKHSMGARATPAPTWPEPSETWTIPVLTAGVMEVSTTRRTSMPSGVPALSRMGRRNRELSPAQMRPILAVTAMASAMRPPRKPATAGEPAEAGPPSPTSSTTALSPMSGALVSGPWPG